LAKSIASSQVEQVVRTHLEIMGCQLSAPRKRGETGPDIIAELGKSTWFIEIIGFQETPPIRSREFYEAFFRVISRDSDDPNHTLVLGLPERFKRGMRQRMLQYPTAWGKLGIAFPNLKIWYVDTEQGAVEEHTWSAPC
jgi:hypothetical protein